MATTSNYALRLLASLKAEAEQVAAAEGSTLNQFINIAVAEKLAALRTERYFKERAQRANLADFDQFLDMAGDEPPPPRRRDLRGGFYREKTHRQWKRLTSLTQYRIAGLIAGKFTVSTLVCAALMVSALSLPAIRVERHEFHYSGGT